MLQFITTQRRDVSTGPHQDVMLYIEVVGLFLVCLLLCLKLITEIFSTQMHETTAFLSCHPCLSYFTFVESQKDPFALLLIVKAPL